MHRDENDSDRNGKIVNDFVPAWDSNHDGYLAIFNAALSGICANPNFFGSTMQGSPEAAVHFANEVTLATIYGEKYVPQHAREEKKQCK